MSTPGDDRLPDWRTALPAADRELFELAGYGSREGMGSRPAVLVVDVTYAFTGTRPMPMREAIAEYRTSCGEKAWRAVPAIQEVLAAARAAGAPVFYSVPRRRGEDADLGGWLGTNARAREDLIEDGLRTRVVTEIGPHPGDVVVEKSMPSVFFGTRLAEDLAARGVDTLICVGGSASGCVRASVVDGFSHGLSMVVVADACFDRSDTMWSTTMFDLSAKYAWVTDAAGVADRLGASG